MKEYDLGKALLDAIVNGFGEVLDRMTEAKTPKKKKQKRTYDDTPYLEVIMTGEQGKSWHENPKKVKFPSFCLFGRLRPRLGYISCAFIGNEVAYELHDCSQQFNGINRCTAYKNVKDLMENNSVEIVKVKIIAKRG